MKNKFTLLIAGIISSTSVYGLDSSRFKGQAVDMMQSTMRLLTDLFQNPIIRRGLSYIALFALFLAIFDSTVKKIKLFQNNSKTVAVPLAILSTFSIIRSSSPSTIEGLFTYLAVGAIIAFILKSISKLKIGGGTGNARHDQKELHKDNYKAKSVEDVMNKEMSKVEDYEEDEEDEEDEAEKSIEHAIKGIDKLNNVLKKLHKIFMNPSSSSDWSFKRKINNVDKLIKIIIKNIRGTILHENLSLEAITKEEEEYSQISILYFKIKNILSQELGLAKDSKVKSPDNEHEIDVEINNLQEAMNISEKREEHTRELSKITVEQKNRINGSLSKIDEIKAYIHRIGQDKANLNAQTISDMYSYLQKLRNLLVHIDNTYYKELTELLNHKHKKIKEINSIIKAEQHIEEIIHKRIEHIRYLEKHQPKPESEVNESI